MKAVEIEFLLKDRGLRTGLQSAQQGAMDLDGTLQRLGGTIAGVFAIDKAKDFVKTIMDVRGEIESLEISFETLAGKTQGKQLFGDIREFAVSTPMMMQDLAKGAQTMLAFNIEAEKVMPILRQIGDISMGDAQKFNSLTLAFAQMSSTGKLMGQDLLQMINAGFNPLTVIAEKTGKSISDLKEEMSAGKISVKMVEDAFASATAEGGKFHGMLEKQSKGLKGAMSNLEGAWQDALNGMGEKNEEVLVGLVDLLTTAVKNFDRLGAAVLTVVSAYGAWKGSLMAIEAYHKMIANQQAAIEASRLSGLQNVLNEAKGGVGGDTSGIDSDTSATNANTAAKTANKTAIEAEIAAMEKELSAKLAVADANHDAALKDMEIADELVSKSAARVAAAEDEMRAALASGDAERIAAAEKELGAAKSDMSAAAEMKNAAAKNVATAASEKEAAATKKAALATQIDAVQKQANTASTGLWAAATRMATTALHGLKAAFASNPLGMAMVAITSIIGLLSVFKSKTDESTDALENLKKASQEQTRELATYKAILATVDKGSQQWKNTLQKVNAMASEYHTTLLSEEDTVEQMAQKYAELEKAIRAAAAQKLMAEAASEAMKKVTDAEKEAMDELIKKLEKGYTTYDQWGHAVGKVQNFKTITTATWAAISEQLMSKSEEIRQAAEKGPIALGNAMSKEVALIEQMFRETGVVTEHEITRSHGRIEDYVKSVFASIVEAGNELERSEGQLCGIAKTAEDTTDTTNRAIADMNYEQLTQELERVKKQLEDAGYHVDDLNNKQLTIQTNDSQVNSLLSKLLQIRSLLGGSLTKGSEADLQRRMKEAKERRSNATPGSKEWIAANKDVGELDKAYNQMTALHAENSGKKSSSSSSRSGSNRTGSGNDPAKDRARQKELQEKQKKDEARAAKDLEMSTAQAIIDAKRDGTEKTLAQIKLDFEKEKEAIRREYEDLREKKKENLKKLWEADPANKKKVFSLADNDPRLAYTADEETNRKAKEDAALAEYTRKLEEQSRADRQAMNDYLKEYGTYQQQKLAIAEEYAEKIKNAQNEGERLRLTAESEKAQRDLDMKVLMEDIDWASVWGDFGAAFRGETEQLLQKLESYVQSDTFRKLPADSQKQLTDAMLQLRSKSGTDWEDINIRKIGQLTTDYQHAVQQLVAAKKAEQESSEKLRKAIEAREKAEKDGDPAAIARAKAAEEAARAEAEKAASSTQAAVEKANSTGAALDTAGKKAVNVLNSTAEALQNLAGGSLQGAFEGLKALANNKQVQKLIGTGIADAFGGATGEIIGAALGLLDLLKDGLGSILANLSDLLFGAVNGIVGDIFSGNILLKPLTSLKDGIGTLLNTVTFGGFSSLFGAKGNSKEVNTLLARLTASNDALRAAIDHLRERMAKTGGDKSTAIYEQALKAMQEQTKNNQKALQAIMSYNAAHHSNNKYIDEKLKKADFARMEQKIFENTGHKVSITKASDIWKLSSEDLSQLQELSDIWQVLTTAGKYSDRALPYLEEYIDDYKELQELQDAWRESITATTFDNVRSSMDALLKDYKKGTADALASVDDMFRDAIARSLSSGDYYDELEAWYAKFADYMKGGLSQAEADELRTLYEQYYKEMAAARDAAYGAAGINPDSESVTQSGKAGAFTTMTQDQGTKLEGLFTSGQIHWASMDALLGRIADHWSSAGDRLTEIADNTSYCRELKEIGDNIRELKRDGIKVR